MPSGKKRKRHKMATHKRKKRLRKNRHKKMVTFKFGSDEQPEYHTFEKLDNLKDFYIQAVRHIQNTLAEGWKRKDVFNLDLYRIE